MDAIRRLQSERPAPGFPGTSGGPRARRPQVAASARRYGAAAGFSLVALFALAASVSAQSAEPAQPEAMAGAGAQAWRIVAVDGGAVSGGPEIRFSPDGGLTGGTGCNRFQARARMAAGQLVIDGPVAVTRMACPGMLDAQERSILGVLEDRIDIGFDPLTGTLRLSNRGVTLDLRAGPAPSGPAEAPGPALRPAPGAAADYVSVFGLEGRLNIRAEATTGAKVLTEVAPGTLLRNLDCREAGGRRWCEVETLDGSRLRGWAAAEYLEPAGAALRAGQEVFDAIGHLPCAQGAAADPAPCEFGVARDAGGSAAVVVIRPDGTRRALFFQDGGFLGADTSQADGYPATGARRDGDRTVVSVGDERYEVADAVVSGG